MFIILMTSICTCFIIIVNLLEAFTYPNFIYSHFRISLNWANAVFGIIIGIVFHRTILKRMNSSIRMTILLIVVWITATASPELISKSVARVGLTAYRINWTIEQKYRHIWGTRVDFFKFVKNITPNTSKILLPPETLPWRYTGNSQFLGAWLYPRTVVATITRKNFLNNYANYDYLLISSETDSAPQNIWPDFPVRAEKIIIYDWDTGQGMEYSGIDWDPADWRDQSPWGLIVPEKL